MDPLTSTLTSIADLTFNVCNASRTMAPGEGAGSLLAWNSDRRALVCFDVLVSPSIVFGHVCARLVAVASVMSLRKLLRVMELHELAFAQVFQFQCPLLVAVHRAPRTGLLLQNAHVLRHCVSLLHRRLAGRPSGKLIALPFACNTTGHVGLRTPFDEVLSLLGAAQSQTGKTQARVFGLACIGDGPFSPTAECNPGAVGRDAKRPVSNPTVSYSVLFTHSNISAKSCSHSEKTVGNKKDRPPVHLTCPTCRRQLKMEDNNAPHAPNTLILSPWVKLTSHSLHVASL